MLFYIAIGEQEYSQENTWVSFLIKLQAFTPELY